MSRSLVKTADQIASRFTDEKSKWLFYRLIVYMTLAGIDVMNGIDIDDISRQQVLEVGEHNPRVLDAFYEFVDKLKEEDHVKGLDTVSLSELMGVEMYTSLN